MKIFLKVCYSSKNWSKSIKCATGALSLAFGLKMEILFRFCVWTHHGKCNFNEKYQSLEKMVEVVHCGTRDDFKNIVITNLKDKFAYKYDSQKGFFVSIDKNILLDELFLYRVLDLEAIYNELSTANKIDNRTKKIIQDFLDKLDDKSVYVEESVKYADFKAYKQSKIKILLYNNVEFFYTSPNVPFEL